MPRTAKRAHRPAGTPLRAVLYTRVSTAEQAESGAGLAAQETVLRAEAVRRGWIVVDHLTDAGASGKSLTGRPALAQALQHVTSGTADALVVAKLDRLSRSLLDFAGVMARAHREGWALVALDVDVDTTTPSGRLVANVMASVAEWERETIGARTRDSLAARKAQGVVLGRPRTLRREALARVRELRAAGCRLPHALSSSPLRACLRLKVERAGTRRPSARCSCRQSAPISRQVCPPALSPSSTRNEGTARASIRPAGSVHTTRQPAQEGPGSRWANLPSTSVSIPSSTRRRHPLPLHRP